MTGNIEDVEQKRVSSESESRGPSVLMLVALFGLVPVFAIGTFLGVTEPGEAAGKRSKITAPARVRSLQDESADFPDSGVIHGSARARPPPAPPFAPELSPASDLPAPTSRSAAEEDAAEEDVARLKRFDENARAFDERLAAFERERSTVDEGATTVLQERLLSALLPLHPEIQVNARCTLSVCVVEVSSDAPVGTMIARISPWLRQNTSLATGDPVDVEDGHSLRLAFDKSELDKSELPEDF